MPSKNHAHLNSDSAGSGTSVSAQSKASESPEAQPVSESSGSSGPSVSLKSVLNQPRTVGVAPEQDSTFTQETEENPKMGVDVSATRTMDPDEQDENLPFAEVASVKIDNNNLLDLGVIFDEYELIRFIGGGGMGNVWLAQDSNLNRLVALKVLQSDKNVKGEIIQRFYSEAQVAALMNHPNISQIYAFRDHRDVHRMYLTMEYVPGENLRDRVKNSGVLKVSETIWIAIQITHALIHMKKFHVVHRDIKPSNILLKENGEAKLIDFGLARITANSPENGMVSVQKDITQVGVTLGTFDYISPEQARDPRMVDSRSDIYSLGCTLYYLLTGHPPFPQGNPLQKLLQHQSDNPMEVRLSRVDVPDSLSEILNKMMKKNQDERYGSPEELLADLEATAQEIGLSFQGATSTLPFKEFPTIPNEKAVFLKRHVMPHLFWIVPLVVFLFAVWFLQRTWTPTPTELELPPAPVEEI
ncbi:MAG: serine/threonine protein kinase [Thermoguttaceae bacterium]|nr:serine/threonine protein kinase [Thermoguttaceae bacterium]MBR0190570.1 serine/threonine protein kinase [Thermoguttaceae bacterium]